MMSLIHLTLLISAILFAGVESDDDDPGLQVTLPDSYNYYINIYFDDGHFGQTYGLGHLDRMIEQAVQYWKDTLYPNLNVIVVGVYYIPGLHSLFTIRKFFNNGVGNPGADANLLARYGYGGYAAYGTRCRDPNGKIGQAGINYGPNGKYVLIHEGSHINGFGHARRDTNRTCEIKDPHKGKGYYMEPTVNSVKYRNFSLCHQEWWKEFATKAEATWTGGLCFQNTKCNCYEKGTVGGARGCPKDNLCECKTGHTAKDCGRCIPYSVRGPDGVCSSELLNAEIRGYVHFTANGISKDDLKTRCENDDKCDHWTYDKTRRVGTGHSYTLAGLKMKGVKSGYTYCDPNALANCTTEGLTYHSALRRKYVWTDTVEACQLKCRQMDSEIFTWHTTYRCDCFNLLTRVYKKLNHVVGPKRVKTNEKGATMVAQPVPKPVQRCHANGSVSATPVNGACVCNQFHMGKYCDKCLPMHFLSEGSDGVPKCACAVKGAAIRGGKVKTTDNVQTPQDCQQICDKDPNCDAFSHFNDTKKCDITGYHQYLRIDKGAISGSKHCDRDDCQYVGVRYQGLISAGEKKAVKTAASCATFCLENQFCAVWSLLGDGSCIMMNLLLFKRMDADAFSGPPRCDGKAVEIPVLNADGYYDGGSVGKKYFNNDGRSHVCKPGYIGKRCDMCEPGVENTGTRKHPKCEVKCEKEKSETPAKFRISDRLFRIVTKENCMEACKERPDCEGISYRPTYCFLIAEKKLPGGPQVDVSGEKFCEGTTEAECYKTNTTKTNLDVVDESAAKTPKECHKKCMDYYLCSKWTWEKPDRCTLYQSIFHSGIPHYVIVSASVKCPIPERPCYPEGSVSTKKIDGVCQCKEGYEYPYCDHCSFLVTKTVVNGTQKCGTTRMGLYIASWSAGWKWGGVYNADECAALCLKNVKCRHFTYFPTYKTCYMQQPGDKVNPSAISGRKFNDTGAPEPWHYGLEYTPSVLIKEIAGVRTAWECQRECILNSVCRTFTFFTNSLQCKLFNIGYRGRVVWRGHSQGGFRPYTTVPSKPITDHTCNPNGTVGIFPFNNPLGYCYCKSEYYGKYCRGGHPLARPTNPTIPTYSCLIPLSLFPFGKNHLYTRRRKTLSDCQELCKNEPKCDGYSWRRNNVCFLKQLPPINMDTTDKIAGNKFCEKNTTAECYEHNPVWYEAPVVMEGKNNVQGSTEDCQQSCIQSYLCVRWIYDLTTKVCDLFGTLAAGATPRGGHASGLKGCTDPWV